MELNKKQVGEFTQVTIDASEIFNFTIHCTVNGLILESLNRDVSNSNKFIIKYTDP